MNSNLDLKKKEKFSFRKFFKKLLTIPSSDKPILKNLKFKSNDSNFFEKNPNHNLRLSEINNFPPKEEILVPKEIFELKSKNFSILAKKSEVFILNVVDLFISDSNENFSYILFNKQIIQHILPLIKNKMIAYYGSFPKNSVVVIFKYFLFTF